ncbi:helix-turn-helix domain-containing protein [Limosilactobacillus fermentum]|uniref:XRE family transcriptional regulator n=1 Tax=Limosilactobacillus fermentum NB-22 TaxID=1408443 RepID=A0A829LR63_LIMFE|nr:helix-turn-helix transcriptional regulator [Limosilactobacillus fermentum]ESS00644.1 XRE family transcriptional regulator [Limosilactobacillus fermentum NB-22]MCH5396360.1 helix-turn-helix domain-containing protein [Limosilactobacillus fermentum]MCZ2327110.1 helix-turn-helix domain-containing protein [Limosilactobacillus fermentum]PJE93429.1 XRE family transcriptional regulator [Limosilactobacillus fermentum]
MNIGERIAQLRKSRSMSQFQLAKTLNIATSTLGMYETNKRKPNMEMLEKLADFFGVSVDYLLGRPEKNDNNNTADLADDDTIFTYKGQPLSDDDKEIIRRLMNGK